MKRAPLFMNDLSKLIPLAQNVMSSESFIPLHSLRLSPLVLQELLQHLQCHTQMHV